MKSAPNVQESKAAAATPAPAAKAAEAAKPAPEAEPKPAGKKQKGPGEGRTVEITIETQPKKDDLAAKKSVSVSSDSQPAGLKDCKEERTLSGRLECKRHNEELTNKKSYEKNIEAQKAPAGEDKAKDEKKTGEAATKKETKPADKIEDQGNFIE